MISSCSGVAREGKNKLNKCKQNMVFLGNIVYRKTVVIKKTGSCPLVLRLFILYKKGLRDGDCDGDK